MAGILKSLFSSPKEPKKPQVNLEAGAEKQVDVTKQRQGRGLASTDLSGMRQMISSYQGGKATLGAG